MFEYIYSSIAFCLRSLHSWSFSLQDWVLEISHYLVLVLQSCLLFSSWFIVLFIITIFCGGCLKFPIFYVSFCFVFVYNSGSEKISPWLQFYWSSHYLCWCCCDFFEKICILVVFAKMGRRNFSLVYLFIFCLCSLFLILRNIYMLGNMTKYPLYFLSFMVITFEKCSVGVFRNSGTRNLFVSK